MLTNNGGCSDYHRIRRGNHLNVIMECCSISYQLYGINLSKKLILQLFRQKVMIDHSPQKVLHLISVIIGLDYWAVSQLLIIITQMEIDTNNSKKNTIKLPLNDTVIEISGDFDSGNLNSASINLANQELQLAFGRDKAVKGSSKTWFHFYIRAESDISNLKLCLLRVNTLSVASKVFDLYRPVVRYEDGKWDRLGTPVQFQTQPEGDIHIRMTIDLKARVKFYVALTYPWSYEESEIYLEMMENKLRGREDIYFNKQTLVHSKQGRQVHLLALSSSDCLNYPPQKYMEHLFPFKDQLHFRQVHKPLVLITSRVHPGQVGASHALNGMLQFLISNEQQAIKLRKQFYFLIIPMLNPDGVFNGNNRMDSLGQNLNRFYHLPDFNLQPSCYAVKSLLELTRRQVFAFFDLHGHANKKSCFLFGNSINNARLQAESVLFAKHLSGICEQIEFKSCNFSKKQMTSKDKNQQLSKQGCARVVVHRWTNSPYCYTLQTGLFKDVRTDEKGILRYGEKFYDPVIYREIGKKMLISFSTILKKDKSLDEMKKFCVDYVSKLDKMKKEKPFPPKSLKMLGNPSETQAQKEGFVSQKKESNESITKDVSRGKQVSSILRKNKAVLLALNDDDDDQ